MRTENNLINKVGIAFLVGGILLGFFFLYPEDWNFGQLIKAFYANFSAEFISIAITILFIDYLYEKKESINTKNRLLRELGSEDRGFTSRALKELKVMGSLSDGSLVGLDLSRANLEGLDFSDANLENVNFEGALLNKAIFKRSNLNGANLNDSVIKEANFDSCTMVGTKLKSCNLYKSKINNATMSNVDFMGSILESCEFIDSKIIDSHLEDSSIKFANFLRADISKSNFLRADVNSMTVKEAKFERCDLTSIQNWEQMANLDTCRFIACLNSPNGLIN